MIIKNHQISAFVDYTVYQVKKALAYNKTYVHIELPQNLIAGQSVDLADPISITNDNIGNYIDPILANVLESILEDTSYLYIKNIYVQSYAQAPEAELMEVLFGLNKQPKHVYYLCVVFINHEGKEHAV